MPVQKNRKHFSGVPRTSIHQPGSGGGPEGFPGGFSADAADLSDLFEGLFGAAGGSRRVRAPYWQGLHYDLVQGVMWVLFREAKRRREENRARLHDLLAGFRSLDIDPLLVSSFERGDVLAEFLTWVELRRSRRVVGA